MANARAFAWFFLQDALRLEFIAQARVVVALCARCGSQRALAAANVVASDDLDIAATFAGSRFNLTKKMSVCDFFFFLD